MNPIRGEDSDSDSGTGRQDPASSQNRAASPFKNQEGSLDLSTRQKQKNTNDLVTWWSTKDEDSVGKRPHGAEGEVKKTQDNGQIHFPNKEEEKRKSCEKQKP